MGIAQGGIKVIPWICSPAPPLQAVIPSSAIQAAQQAAAAQQVAQQAVATQQAAQQAAATQHTAQQAAAAQQAAQQPAAAQQMAPSERQIPDLAKLFLSADQINL